VKKKKKKLENIGINKLIRCGLLLQLSSDGQKMVLQLVLPQGGTDNMKHEPPITPDYIQYGKQPSVNHVINLPSSRFTSLPR
jgi:hypothetical protein